MTLSVSLVSNHHVYKIGINKLHFAKSRRSGPKLLDLPVLRSSKYANSWFKCNKILMSKLLKGKKQTNYRKASSEQSQKAVADVSVSHFLPHSCLCFSPVLSLLLPAHWARDMSANTNRLIAVLLASMLPFLPQIALTLPENN